MTSKDNGKWKKDEEIITISSVSQYIEKLNEIRIDFDESIKFFYRGESRYYGQTIPSILREKEYFLNEREITLEAYGRGVRTIPTDWVNFDKISTFQHHSGLTRMLDVTQNALTALYFTCSSNNDSKEGSDGYVILYNGLHTNEQNKISEKEDVKYHGNSSKLNNLNYSIEKLHKEINNNKTYIEKLKNINNPNYWKFKSFRNIHRIIEEKNRSSNIKYFLSDTVEILSTISLLPTQLKIELSYYALFDILTNKNSELRTRPRRLSYEKLYSEIKRRTPAFKEKIQGLDLFKPIIVVPNHTEERILRQDGAFILTGLSYIELFEEALFEAYKLDYNALNGRNDISLYKGLKKTQNNKLTEDKYYELHKEYTAKALNDMRVKKGNKPIRFEIKKEDKLIILKNLEDLGINTGKIYVNLDNISKHLKEKYKRS